MAFREAFCVIFTSAKLPLLSSAVRIRACKEIPARRICRRSALVTGTDASCAGATALNCSDIGWLDKPLGETCSGAERRSEEHTSELQSHSDLVCRLLLE